MYKILTILIFGMSLLLAACGSNNTPVPVASTPSSAERITPNPTLAPVMETSTQSPTPDSADADVTHVRAIQDADGSWTFHVTVSHSDTGWEDYSNGWDIVFPDGSKFEVHESDPFTRLLAHPHVNEQPFTRSQRGIIIPKKITQVTVRAHDIVDGWGGQEILVDLEKDSGEGFDVERK